MGFIPYKWLSYLTMLNGRYNELVFMDVFSRGFHLNQSIGHKKSQMFNQIRWDFMGTHL